MQLLGIDMQIDAVRFKPLSKQEKRRQRTEGLYLYCGKLGREIKGFPEKTYEYQMQSASTPTSTTLENEDVQPR